MKHLLSILILLALGLVAHGQPATLTNGQWVIETGLGANSTSGKAGGGAINTNFAFAFRALTNGPALGWTNVYVSLRTDGRDGSGTITDPRDGSTAAKFSAILSNMVDGTRYVLGPGTFTKYPDFPAASGIRPRVTIEGAGEYQTTIQADTNFVAGWAAWITSSAYFLMAMEVDGQSDNYPGAVLKNLTLDVRAHLMPRTSTNYPLAAIYGYGDGALIENVTIKNTADKHGYFAESFPFVWHGTNWTARRVTVKEHWSATNGTFTGHTAFQGGGYGTFEDCVADFRSTAHASGAVGYSHGFGAVSGVRIVRPVVYGRPDGMTEGVYTDVASLNSGTQISGGLFENVASGLTVNGIPATNVSFGFNTVRLSTSPASAGISDNTGGVTWFGWRVWGNNISSRSGTPEGHYAIHAPATWENSELIANQFQHGLSNRLGGAHTNLSLFGNRLSNGGMPTNAVTGESLTFNTGTLKRSVNAQTFLDTGIGTQPGTYGLTFRIGEAADVGAGVTASLLGNVGNSYSFFTGGGTGTNITGIWLDGSGTSPFIAAWHPAAVSSVTNRTLTVRISTNLAGPHAGPVAAQFRGDGTLTVTNLMRVGQLITNTLAGMDTVYTAPNGRDGFVRVFVGLTGDNNTEAGRAYVVVNDEVTARAEHFEVWQNNVTLNAFIPRGANYYVTNVSDGAFSDAVFVSGTAVFP